MNRCRLCRNEELSTFLDLGFTPPADQFVFADQLAEPIIHYPLTVARCDACFFVQLNYIVPPEVLYQDEYPYESSLTKAGRDHFDKFAEMVIERCDLEQNDLVIDIGSNVGVLLRGFQSRGCQVLGIEPAANIARSAIEKGIPTLPVFFEQAVSQKVVPDHGLAKVITGTNVFAHMDDLHVVMSEVDLMLAEDGVFIVEAPYLGHLLDNLEYDTIYHEHLSYLSVTPLVNFFHSVGFELFDILPVDIHGGSLRFFIARTGVKSVLPVVGETMQIESDSEMHSLNRLNSFAESVKENRLALLDLLHQLKMQGKKIAAVSAPAKGMTLLNYSHIGSQYLEFITEKSTLKIDKFTPGSHLLVRPDSALVEFDIDYALLLAWNFKDEIMQNLEEFRAKGGKFIIPIPKPEIV